MLSLLRCGGTVRSSGEPVRCTLGGSQIPSRVLERPVSSGCGANVSALHCGCGRLGFFSAEYLFCGRRVHAQAGGSHGLARIDRDVWFFLIEARVTEKGARALPPNSRTLVQCFVPVAGSRIASWPWTPTFPASSCSASTSFERAGSMQMVRTRNTLATSSGGHSRKQRPPIAAFWGYSSHLMRSHPLRATYTSAHGNG